MKCDNCNQYKIQRLSSILMIVGFMMLPFGLLLSLILIGIPMLIMAPFFLLAGIILRFSKSKDKYFCQNCKKSFTVKQAEALAA